MGEDITKDLEKIREWRAMIEKIEFQRMENLRQRQLWLEQERVNFINDKRANIDFTGKLLKLSQQDPNLWREIKNEMYQKRLMDEKKYVPGRTITTELAKPGGEPIDLGTQILLMDEGMKEVMNDLGGQMARDTEVRVNNEDNRAALKIQKKVKESKACIIF